VPTPSANHTPSATSQVFRESIVLADTGAQQLRSHTGRLLSRGGASAVASARLARRATRDDRARANLCSPRRALKLRTAAVFVWPQSVPRTYGAAAAVMTAAVTRCLEPRRRVGVCCHLLPPAEGHSTAGVVHCVERAGMLLCECQQATAFRTGTNGAFRCVASS
jgi:hypothetical protein